MAGNEVTVTVSGGTTTTVTVPGSTGTPAPTITNGGTANVSVTSVGDRGPQGDVGPATTLTIGTVTGGATAAATLTGPAGAQVLNLTLPQGATGSTGSTGATGATGATGPAGPANTLTIGTTTTGAAGSSASAAITGTAPNQTLSLTIPRGDTGANIELQSTSTHLQWRPVGGTTWTNLVALTAITGPQGSTGASGTNGTNGSSVELQTTSTHIQWRLVGGSTWTDLVALSEITGPQGAANSLSIGTVTTGAAGSSASATVTGDAPSQTLNLVIPRGDAGLSGLSWASVPIAPGSPGAAGDMAYDATNLYVCVAQDTWKRAALATWTPTDPLFSSVSLLLHMDGSGSTFTDSSGTPKTVTANGSATQSTAQSRFGGKSGLFDGSASLSVPPSLANLPAGTDFTIEAWIYPSGTPSGAIFGSGGNGHVWFGIQNGQLFLGRTDLAVVVSSANFAIAPNQWQHVAVTRAGDVVRLFINGTQVSTATQSFSFPQPSALTIGSLAGLGSQNYSGHIDEFRITSGAGAARYTANFTPPTAAFPDS
jgi:hypothetical protein